MNQEIVIHTHEKENYYRVKKKMGGKTNVQLPKSKGIKINTKIQMYTKKKKCSRLTEQDG